MVQVLRYAAFTDDPAGGNPAGVVLDAAGLGDAAMQRVAVEVGYSETAFVVPRGPGRFGLRYFSPLAEVAFCGHATIATAVALAERAGPGELRFTTPAGEVLVTTTEADGVVLAGMRTVPTSSRPATPEELDGLLRALHWSADHLDPALAPHVAFAGNHHPVLAARTRERLADLDYDFAGLQQLMTEQGWTTVQLVWRESADLFHARDPFPVGGVVEDPATGAAAAALGGYLRARGEVTAPRRVTVRQGEDMGRPSLLLVDVVPDDARVTVTGRAVPIPVG